MSEAFTRFEHEGWERVAGKYDSTWSSSTRQFIPPLLDAAGVAAGTSVLDVGCGPGYVSAAAAERGAKPSGLDFSGEMVAIAKRMFPHIDFREGDAQNLPFAAETFDRVVGNFSFHHMADPGRAFAEACRVLKPGGRLGFTIWAHKKENIFIKVLDDAITAHADPNVQLPEGPPYYLFENEDGFRQALGRAGFDAVSMAFRVHQARWHVPSARFVFEAERNAGVRTAGFLACQSPECHRAIEQSLETGFRPYATPDGSLSIPLAAYVVAITKL